MKVGARWDTARHETDKRSLIPNQNGRHGTIKSGLCYLYQFTFPFIAGEMHVERIDNSELGIDGPSCNIDLNLGRRPSWRARINLCA